MLEKQLLLVDGHGLAYRGYYALPEMMSMDGTPTQAIVGFFSMLLKAVDEWSPEYIGLFFDPKGETKRKEVYREYKEGRRPTPDSFKKQLPLIMQLAGTMGFPVFTREGIEADDLIAATALNALEHDVQAIILSADKDMFQLLRSGLVVARPTRGVSEIKKYDAETFEGEYGFTPPAMADYLALVGDSVDNIPGIPGIGDKSAKQLLASFGSIEAIYKNIDQLTSKRKALFEEYHEKVLWSRSLVLPIETDAIPLDLLLRSKGDTNDFLKLCHGLGLKNLEKRIIGSGVSRTLQSASETPETVTLPQVSIADMREVPLSEILNESVLALTYQNRGSYPLVSNDQAYLVSREGRYVPLLSDNELLQLKIWLKNGTLILVDYKVWCAAEGELGQSRGIRDICLIHYLLHPDMGRHDVSDILGRPASGLIESGMDLFSVYAMLEQSPYFTSILPLLEDIEVPLSPVLSKMEQRGFRAKTEDLQHLAHDLGTKLNQLEASVRSLAGEEINLNSPKQVSALLFEKLRLPVIRKTKTGYSTDVLVLEELARLPEPLGKIPKLMLEYRELSKLQQSFVSPYLKYSQAGDSIVRTTFDQTATGTGRLASHNPNVQTLPTFGEWALRFRRCLLPTHVGNVFVSADYSQIELRVLAHLSHEERLLEAFSENRDIHTETASWVFGLPSESISPEQRRFAKVINFGLLYGMSAHGLARRMGIKRHEAAAIVERYFKVLPKVESYLKKSMNESKSRGYTLSLFGRIRPLTEAGGGAVLKGGALDRVAVNTPIQSAAADITKLAMIQLDKSLLADHWDVYQVLQVHDSLVCECPAGQEEDCAARIVEVMEGVSPLDIPLRAEAKKGSSMADI